MLNRNRKKCLRWGLSAVLLIALVFRAAIPFGYMAAAAPDGTVHIEVCPDHTMPEMPGSDSTGSSDQSHASKVHCPFALSAAPPLHAVHVVVAFDRRPTLVVRGFDLRSEITFTPTRVQQARAPPVSALIDS
jgi:hypothetical protein